MILSVRRSRCVILRVRRQRARSRKARSQRLRRQSVRSYNAGSQPESSRSTWNTRRKGESSVSDTSGDVKPRSDWSSQEETLNELL